MGKWSEQTIFQRRIWIASRHMKSCSTSLIIRECKLKPQGISPHTCLNDHHQKGKWWQMLVKTWKKGNHMCWWDCKLIQLLWKAVWRILKKLKIELLYDPDFTPGYIYPKEMKTLCWREICAPRIHSSIIYNSQDMETTCVSINRWMDQEYVVCICVFLCMGLCVCIHNRMLFSLKNEGILLLEATWMDLKCFTAKWNKSDRKTNTLWFHFYV